MNTLDLISSSLLETFLAVAKTGSVTDAAALLHRSQPAVSQRIKQLEDQLGVALFQASGRGIMLTRDGELFMHRASDVVARLRELPHTFDQSSTLPRGVLRVGALATMSRYILADAIETMIRDYPEVTLRVELGLERDLLQRVHDGWLDGVFFIGHFDATRLQPTHLGDVHITVAAPVGMFAGPPTLAQMAEHRLLLWAGAADPSFSLIERHARSHDLVEDTTPEISHIDTLKHLVERGVGYALLPDYVLRPEIAAHTIEAFRFPGFDQTFPIAYYRYEGRVETQAFKRFSAIVANTVNELPKPMG